MRRPAICLFCVTIIGAVPPSGPTAARGAMIPLANTLTSWAYSGQSGGTDDKLVVTNAVAPFAQTDVAMAGDSMNASNYDFALTSSGVEWKFDFDHVRDESAMSFVRSDAVLDFQVSQATDFSVAARYEYTGAERKFAFVRLFDNLFSTNDPVFDWTQSTAAETPGFFEFAGTGELLPGNSYRLEYRFQIDGNGTTAAAAVGNLSFRVGEPVLAGTTGDANADRRVDIDDLNLVRNHFGAGGQPDGSLAGDTYPYDGAVNIDDLNSVRNNFGNASTPVPEPSTIVLSLWAAGCALPRLRLFRLRPLSR